MPKAKSHKGLLKRVRVTARGKVKFKRAGSSHLNGHQSGKKMRQLRRKRLIGAGDIRRVQRLLGMPLRAGR